MKFQLTLKGKYEPRTWARLSNDCRWVTKRDFDDGWKPILFESLDLAQAALNMLMTDKEWCISHNEKHDVHNMMPYSADKGVFEIEKVSNGTG